MIRNSKNGENGNEQNVHGLRKKTYWEKYGVKRFPYPGRRRYSPCVYQSEDGGIIISNDVFGLTIRQFERTYNACLDRRKAHKQYILIIRYPDKTSNEYMEYLQDSTDCKKVNCNGNEFNDIKLSEHLVNTAGTEIDMRTRQQLFIIKDLIINTTETVFTHISSGSLAEGIDLPGSDIDIMYVIKDVDVILDLTNIKQQVQRTTLLMEMDVDHPGFTRLQLIAERVGGNNVITYRCCERTNQGLYLSVNKFVSCIDKIIQYWKLSQHGPCFSDQYETIDLACCLKSKYLPYNTIQWASRYRKQWPPNSTIDQIKQYGCLLVPIGPRNVSNCNILWRLSFSVAEKHLVHSFNFTQLLCYCLLKLTLKHIINTNKQAEGLLCSYFLKTALFWVSEEVDIDTFQISKLFVCFSHCLNKLKLWVQNCYCPNYFIPENNMFLGKVNSENNTILLNVLDAITCNGIDGLTNKIFPNDNASCHLLRTEREYSFIRLDFLFYRTSCVYNILNTTRCLKTLMFLESLIKSNHSTFIKDVCKVHYASISQYAAQLLPPPTTNTETYNKHRRYHRHVHAGIKTDAVSGWLLYAAFYYVTGQFDVTLRLTNYILSRCSADMLLIGCSNYNDEDSNNYRSNVHHSITLKEKMRIATVGSVIFPEQSSLIPGELQLKVNNHIVIIPPTVMGHCLRFLCFHHLGDISNRQQALHNLYVTVKDMNFIASNVLSDSLTILGVCFEIAGEKDTAYQLYNAALQCDGGICPSAEAKKSKLLES